MKTLRELRAAIKPLGFNVKTKQMSWGPHAVFTALDGTEMLGTVHVGKPDLWTPLLDYLRDHAEDIQELWLETGMYGIRKF